MSRTQTNYFVQHGSSDELRVSDDSAYVVVRQTWRGSQIVNTRPVSRHSSCKQAEIAADRLRKQSNG